MPTPGPKTGDPAPWSAESLGRAALPGALLGLVLGLIVWAWTFWQPAPAPSSPAASTVAQVPTPTASGSARRTTGVLSDDAVTPAGSAVASHAAEESPRATATRFAWSVRFRLDDFAGALAVIDGARLSASERESQLHELVDMLVPRDWVYVPAFPLSNQVELVYHANGGRDRLMRRWDIARQVVSSLTNDPQKVAMLSRMELFARVLHEAPRHPEEAIVSQPLSPMQEVDEKGLPVAARRPAAPPKTANEPPMIDIEKEVRSLREEAGTCLASLKTTLPHDSPQQVLESGWNLFRTGLFTVAGASFSVLGGMILKTYSELITKKITEVGPFHAALVAGTGSGETVPQGPNPTNVLPAAK